MKLLLTSAGLTNPTIVQALRDLLGKPTQESIITVIPTGHTAETGDKSWVLQEDFLLPHQLGWKQFNIVDLAAVASLDKSLWWPQLEETDLILVGGGSVFYLSYWMQKAGLFEALPKWLESKVYVGISAGSQVVGSDLYATVEVMEREGVFTDTDYDEIGPVGQSSSKTLKLVDFTFRPHLNSDNFPKIRLPYLEQVAQTLKTPMYAVDDNSAIRVVGDTVDVVGTGQWHKLEALI
ncbi:Type 1 glutamine amidotransferase-like domain-containing protein [Candidatus Saccharibacteria bacterium]|nr:Type 1 glutamine amidotransferase-like domain-containing protein [Candidatus Saccharibacteria bacterium]